MSVELISQAAYARRRGVDPTTVRDAIRAGRISLIDGRIDPAVADVQWERNTRARVRATTAVMPAPTPPQADAAPLPPESDYAVSRARRERAAAEREEIALEEDRKRLIDKQAVLTTIYTAFRMLRDTCLPLGREVAARAAALSSAAEVQALIDEAMRARFRQAHDKLLAAAVRGLGGEPEPELRDEEDAAHDA
ncbi:hypothetical protein [Leptothrix discophora]|uniref:Uncharacterized protein n=1 Tax=Leptothrix discophora TaxID=89 RepID=A0ABT9G1J3_LEPDI|nr:hypothetical protein [Leptothrix discophora]MDP4300359.1 hypothetical protein [Leptothrix discophora]